MAQIIIEGSTKEIEVIVNTIKSVYNDVGLLIAFPDYVQRKDCLEKYVEQIRSVKCEL